MNSVDYTRPMDAAELLVITRDWSPWDRGFSHTVDRSVRFPDALTDRTALVIQGVRRCGKSTLMQQMVRHYRLEPRDCAFLNLEDPRLARALDWTTLDAWVRAIRDLRKSSEKLYFFIDEIQNAPGWERWLRAMLDRPDGDHFVISGSNASLLSGELGSTLTGRHRTIELYPFSFDEFRTDRPSATVTDYLRLGGFPEPVATSDGDELLRQYFYDIVDRDVRERLGARSSLPIRQVVQMAYESAGSELSLRRIAGAIGVSTDTVGAYLTACEEAYLVLSAPFFAYSERKRTAFRRKYYPIDTALRRVVVIPGGADHGKALECATFIELKRRYREVCYWRGDGEVDFVVQEGRRVIPIQVTAEAPRPRHEKALEGFYEQFPHADEAVWVTMDSFAGWVREAR